MKRTIIATSEEINWLDTNHESLMKRVEVSPSEWGKEVPELTGDTHTMASVVNRLDMDGPCAGGRWWSAWDKGLSE